MKRKVYECMVVAIYLIGVAIMAIFSIIYLNTGWVVAPDCVKGLLLPIVVIANLVWHQMVQSELERCFDLFNDEEELS